MTTAIDSPSAPEAAGADSPYVGLSYYTEEFADVFFGRESERSLIISNLRAARLTVLYARSGVGKSSLLRAGVAARLRQLARRSVAERDEVPFVPVVFSSWRDEPVEELIDEVERAIASFIANQQIELPRRSLVAAAEDAASKTGATLLVVLDQFEEYFLYGPSERQPGRFADELAKCLNQVGLPVNFLIAVREDAYAGVGDLLAGKIANPLGNSLKLDYMDREAARAAIVRPIEHFNSLHSTDQPIQIEPELVEAVLDQVRTGQVSFDQEAVGGVSAPDGAPLGQERIETPYLQLVLTVLWERELKAGSTVLRRSTLDELGGAKAIVRSHLDHAMSLLSEEERDTAAEIFNQLVTPSGTKIVHTIADLAQYSRRDPEHVRTLIEKLSGDMRILRPVPAAPGESEPRVEIFHDVLAPAILAWRTGQSSARLEREREAAEHRARVERRRRLQALGLAAIVGLLAVAFVVVAIEARLETTRAHQAQHVALSRQLAAQSSSDLQGGALGRGVLLALEAYRMAPTSDAKHSLVRSLIATAPMVAYLSGHTGDVTSVAYSPDGKLIASGGAEGTVLLQSMTTGKTVRTLRGPSAALEAISFSPSGGLIASGGLDRRVYVWSVPGGRPVQALQTSQAIYGVAFNPRGNLLAATGSAGTVMLYDPATGVLRRTLGAPGPGASGVAFSPDGRTLAVGAGNQVVLWNVLTGKRIRAMSGNQGAIQNVAFAPVGNDVASAGKNQTIVVWDAATGHRLLTLRGHTGQVNGVAFSPDGRVLASAGDDHKVILWSTSTGARLQTLQGHSAAVEAVAFAPNGRTLASGGDDNEVIVWSSSPLLLEQSLALTSPPLAVASNPSGTILATGALNGTVALWDARSGQFLKLLLGHTGPVQSVAFSPDGSVVAAGSTDQTVMMWDAATGVLEHTLQGHQAPVYSVAFSPDGRTLASGAGDQRVILWNAKTGAREQTLHGQNDFVYAVAFSPDSKTLASASADRTVVLWDVATGNKLRTLTGHTGAVESVAFNSSGKILASAGDDGTVMLWDPQTGRRLGDPLQADSTSVLSVAFSRTGSILAAGGADQNVILWDLNSRLGYPMYGHSAPVQSVTFMPAGGTVVSAGLDGTVQEDGPVPTRIDFGFVSRRLCGVVRRNLQRSEWNQYLSGQPYQRTCPGA